MFSARTTQDLLESRLDAEFYHPAYIENEVAIRNCGLEVCSVADIATKLKCGPFGSSLHASQYVDSGVPFVHPTSFSSGWFDRDKTEFISSTDHGRLASTQFNAPALVFARVGSPCCSVLPRSLGAFNIQGDVVGVQCNGGFDTHFVYAFFLSCYGRVELNRYQAGSTRPRTNTSTLAELLVVGPSLKAQNYIGDKVRNAEKAEDLARSSATKLSLQLASFFAGRPEPSAAVHSRVSADKVNTLRLEAEYYEPLAVWAEQEIVNGKYACMPLSDLASRIKDGPGGWGVSTNDYVASGVPVIRGVNIVHGDCDLSDCVFVSHDKHRELKSHKTVRGSVVLSVRGTIGRSAVFDVPGCDEASLNAAVVTIECRDSIHPHYLAEFFNSRVGQVQSRRIGNGAVQQNMNLTEAGSLLVVVPPPEIQLEIAHARQRRIFSHRLRRDLVLAAKFLVDGVVDRKISDNELATAQSQLEEGDCTGDRAILSRLHEGGIDSTGTRLLFPDLDAYYETLRMAEQALMDGGDE